VLILGGLQALRVVWFPIAYLLAMLPIWDVFTERLHYPFQQLSAVAGGWMLGTLGVPVYHQGLYLHLPNVTLEVARVCSGVNYLIAVGTIGVPLAYTLFPDQLRRWLLVCFGLVVAIAANPLRVALIGIVAYYGLITNTHGPHAFQGIFVAMLGYLALFVGAGLLSSWRSLRPAGVEDASSHRGASSQASFQFHLPRQGMTAAAAATGLFVVLGTVPFGSEARALDGQTIAGLPERIGNWQRVDETMASAAGTSARNVSRLYLSSSGHSAEVYIGPVLDSESGVDPYWPNLVGLGGSPLSLLLEHGETVTVRHAIRGTGPDRRVIFYWYSARGAVYADIGTAKLLALWHRGTGFGRQPALVVVSCPARPASEEIGIDEALADFARQLLIALRQEQEPPKS